ncbi:MAG: cytochrome-c oxidase, cbb3-type subunit III [Gammaproteobacteria bacterium]|nr:MAG: cytochrome-c oxidase, cbb3-type subunit III [Gammaproteobacteria bacterium]UCH39267.1 MAG: cytochrome-c oxidase, cbb3-type subunit III [Gammaproteobacteria bacterium]
MADFNSEFWHWYIAILTVLSILACVWLIRWMTAGFVKKDETETTGHVWDSDLTELNNPLPRWWLGLFYITLAFGGFYLLLFPGLGSFSGFLNWTSTDQYEKEVAAIEAEVGPLFAKYQQTAIIDLIKDGEALKVGERLYLNYCATCHGSDARGARGYPNLRDGNWLWGGDPENIKTSIMMGRQAAMPAWEAPLGGERGVDEVTQYLLSLSGRATIEELAANGKTKYDTFCVACHGPEGKGNIAMGAPNLTDDSWLYGGSINRISESIAKGRNGQMPAHGEFLGEAKVHLLAAYVYGLSQEN